MSALPALQKIDNWKNEPWLLLVIGGPLIVVCACLYTGFLAFNNADKVVTEDYYKQGMKVNADIRRDARARALNVNATLHLESSGLLRIKVDSKGDLPDVILLSIATSEANSLVESTHRLPLKQLSNGVYQGTLSDVKSKLMHIKLEGNGWRLTGDWHQPLQAELKINANQKHLEVNEK